LITNLCILIEFEHKNIRLEERGLKP